VSYFHYLSIIIIIIIIPFIMSMPIFREIGHIFLDESACLQYLIENGVLTVPIYCAQCGNLGIGQRSLTLYQCNKKDCRKKFSIYHGTFFFNCKIKCNVIMLGAYKFLNGDSSSSIVRELGISKHTAAAWLGYFR